MRVMVLVKADANSEAGAMPTPELLRDMMNYNEELVKAGIMVAGDGLQPTSKGKRVHFSGSDRTVIDGPFAETKELVAGFWIWEVESMDAAVEAVCAVNETKTPLATWYLDSHIASLSGNGATAVAKLQNVYSHLASMPGTGR